MTDTVFRQKALGIMDQLKVDFNLSTLDAAAIMGNLGHESGGLTNFQEDNPTVPGSRGGYGWAQWTGPRRRSFEAYCSRHNLDPKSDKANYGFLFVELTGSEKKAIPALKAVHGLKNKVVAFEKAFLRAGVKHYDSRFKWAKRALDAYQAAAGTPGSVPEDPGTEAPSGPLKRGSKGRAVHDWQLSLNRVGYHINVDGDFGAETEAATKVFQRAHGLDDDGHVGPVTLAAMDLALLSVLTMSDVAAVMGDIEGHLSALRTRLGI